MASNDSIEEKARKWDAYQNTIFRCCHDDDSDFISEPVDTGEPYLENDEVVVWCERCRGKGYLRVPPPPEYADVERWIGTCPDCKGDGCRRVEYE